jgi:hypothetical protein
MIRYQDLLEQLDRGELHGVFIDDTGSPGLANTPVHLHPDRKTWVAVIVDRSRMAETLRSLGRLLWQLRSTVGAPEFHFSDLYNGKRKFATLALRERLQLLRLFVQLFDKNDLQILVQTYDPEQVARMAQHLDHQSPAYGPLRLDQHEDAALLMLLWRVKEYLASAAMDRVAGRVFVDKGRFSNGTMIGPIFPPYIAEGRIFFADSSSIFPIQLADFAAFALNRSQLLFGKAELSRLDREFLELVSPLAMRYRNIAKFFLSHEEWIRRKHLRTFASVIGMLNRAQGGEDQRPNGSSDST